MRESGHQNPDTRPTQQKSGSYGTKRRAHRTFDCPRQQQKQAEGPLEAVSTRVRASLHKPEGPGRHQSDHRKHESHSPRGAEAHTKPGKSRDTKGQKARQHHQPSRQPNCGHEQGAEHSPKRKADLHRPAHREQKKKDLGGDASEH